MKDIVIKGRSIRREVLVFVWCVVAMIVLNAIAIAIYKTSWHELYSVWWAVLLAAIGLYIILFPLRLLARWLGRVLRRGRGAKR